jgi:hypothetical protein
MEPEALASYIAGLCRTRSGRVVTVHQACSTIERLTLSPPHMRVGPAPIQSFLAGAANHRVREGNNVATGLPKAIRQRVPI